jgi:two-component system sensor histidine kinase KdpD
MEMRKKIFNGFQKLRNFGKIAVIWVLSTLLAIFLSHIGVRAENLLLIYVVGVILCSVETRSMLWSISSSIVFVFTFNYLLTSPRFTFQVDDPNYIISLLIFIIVAFIAASLTDKLQKQMNLDRERAEILLKLNTIGSGFLNLSGR